MSKVYIVVIESTLDYETGLEVEVYADYHQASESVMSSVYSWKEEGNSFGEHQEEYHSESDGCLTYEIYEEGDYTRNHITWNIFARNVIPYDGQ